MGCARHKVGQEIDRLVDAGFLRQVEISEYGTPLVVVPKANGELRISRDHKVTVNRDIIVDL